MKRDQAAAMVNKIHERFFLLRRNLCVVGINDDGIVAGQFVRVQIVERFGVGIVDVRLDERGFDLLEAVGRAVMALVTEKEDADAFRVMG